MSEIGPATAPDEAARVTAPGRAAVGVLELVLVSAFTAVAAVATYHFLVMPRQLPRFATVDLQAMYRDQEAAFAQIVTREGVNDQERDAAFARAEAFARALPGALEALAQECRCVVLAGNAVAGHYDVMDLTAALQRKVGP